MKHIFIVDDDKVLTTILSTYLGSLNFKITTFHCGKNALDQMNAGESPDLIISDLNMPYMNGQEFLEKLGESTTFKKVPILLFTGTETDLTEKTYPEIKAFVKKPCHPDRLFEIIKEHIS